MTFPQAVRTCFTKYLTFSGRAGRKEFWYFLLFVLLGSIVAGVIDAMLFGTTVVETAPGQMTASADGPVATIFSLAIILPYLAAGWRRMHDTGRSGLYLLYPLIVIIGIATFIGMLGGFVPLLSGDFGTLLAGGSALVIGLALLVLFLSPLMVIWWLSRPSQPGPNAYGPEPARDP